MSTKKHDHNAQAIVAMNVGLYGFHMEHTCGEESGQCMSHTVGFWRSQGFEVLLPVLDAERAVSAVAALAEKFNQGYKLELGVPVRGLFMGNAAVKFCQCDVTAQQHIEAAHVYFGETYIPVVQMVLADVNGRFPEDKDYCPEMRRLQPLFYQPPVQH